MTPARADAFGCSPFFAGIRAERCASGRTLNARPCVCVRVRETSPLRALGKERVCATSSLVHMHQKERCYFAELLAHIDANCTNAEI